MLVFDQELSDSTSHILLWSIYRFSAVNLCSEINGFGWAGLDSQL